MDRNPRRKLWYEESPLYQKWKAEWDRDCRQANILIALGARFGEVPEPVIAMVRSITDLAKLTEALRHTVRCRTIGGFSKRIGRLLRECEMGPATEE